MIRKSIMDNLEIKITIPAVLLFLVFSVLSTPSAFANEGCTKDEISTTELNLDKPDDGIIRPVIDINDIAIKKEIKLLPDFNDGYYVDGIKIARVQGDNSESDETGFIYAKAAMPGYETESIEAGDILRSIPSITTENNKTLGLIIPPFAYFAKKF
jgi:hypothetical protein